MTIDVNSSYFGHGLYRLTKDNVLKRLILSHYIRKVKKLARRRKRRQKNYFDSSQMTLFQIVDNTEVVKTSAAGILFKYSHDALLNSMNIVSN